MTSLQEIRLDQEPQGSTWQIIPLYKQSLAGLLTWQIYYDGKLHISSGVVENPQVIDVPDNENPLKEARRFYTDLFLQGYRPVETNLPDIKIMKGEVYTPAVIHHWPIAIQVVISDSRFFIKLSKTGVVNNPFPDDIYNQIITKLFAYLPPCYLDCYFLEKKLYITDIYIPNLPFEERYTILFNGYKNFIFDNNYTSDLNIYLINVTLASNNEKVEEIAHEFATSYQQIRIMRLAGPNPTKLLLEESRYKEGKTNNVLLYTSRLRSDEETKEEEVKVQIEISESDKQIAQMFNFLQKGDKTTIDTWLEQLDQMYYNSPETSIDDTTYDALLNIYESRFGKRLKIGAVPTHNPVNLPINMG